MKFNKLKISFFQLDQHLKKKELCTICKKNICNNSLIDIKKDHQIYKINVENFGLSTLNYLQTMKNSKINMNKKNNKLKY